MEDHSIRSASAGKIASRVRRASIRSRLLLAFVAVALLPGVVITAVSAAATYKSGYAQVIEHLDSVTRLKEVEITDWLRQLQLDLRFELGSPYSVAPAVLESPQDSEELSSAYRTEKSRLDRMVSQARRFEVLSLIDANGEVRVSTQPGTEGESRRLEPYFQGGMKGPGVYVVASASAPTIEGANTIVIVYPVVDTKGRTLGVLVGQASPAVLNNIMEERAGLGASGETYLVGQNHILLTASRFPGYTPKKSYVRSAGANAALKNHSGGSGQYRDYRGIPVIGVHRWIPSLQVALMAEVDTTEALGPLYRTAAISAGVALVAVLIAIAVSVLIARGISRPVATLAQTAERIAAGNLELTVPVEQADEVGTLAAAFNSMTAKLRALIADLNQRVAELNLTSQELQQSEAQYRRIVDTASEGIWVIGPDGIVTFANARLAVMLGCSIDDVIGHPATDFISEGDVPDHLKVLEDRRYGKSGDYDRRLRRKDGETVWASVSATPIFYGDHQFGGSIAMLTDITERKLAEDELRLSRQKLARHVEQTLLGVIEWDMEFRVREWNPAAEAIFGYSREEALGRSAVEIIVPKGARRQVESVFRALMQDEGGRLSTNENVTKDGRTILCEWVNTLLTDDAGNAVGGMSLVRDVTEREEMEAELEELSVRDELTGLYNRRHFEEELARVGRGRRFPVSIVMGDLDGLKKTNDSEGHSAGDALLQRAAEVLRDAFRGDELIARVGGDEFAVILPGIDAAEAQRVLRRVQRATDEHNAAHGGMPVSISLGASTAATRNQLAEAVDEADARMYEAKRAR